LVSSKSCSSDVTRSVPPAKSGNLVPHRKKRPWLISTAACCATCGVSEPQGSLPITTDSESTPHSSSLLLFARVLALDHLKGLLQIENRYFRGDGGIGAAPRLAAAHRVAETNAPGGHLNHTPGEGACVSHVAACTVLRPPAPSEAPPDALVPAKG